MKLEKNMAAGGVIHVSIPAKLRCSGLCRGRAGSVANPPGLRLAVYSWFTQVLIDMASVRLLDHR
jgi:hypothetical protein